MKIFRTSKLLEQFQFTTLIRESTSENKKYIGENKKFYDRILLLDLVL